jgi:O-antigen/teichoic acid export membrane protein
VVWTLGLSMAACVAQASRGSHVTPVGRRDSKEAPGRDNGEASKEAADLAAGEAYSARRNVLEGGGWSALALVVSLLLSAPLTIVLVRTMSAKGYGVFALAVSVISILTPLAAAGLSYSVARAGAAARVHSEDGLAPVVRAGLRLSLRLSVAAGAAFALVLGLLSMDSGLSMLVLAVAALSPVVLIAPLQGVLVGMAQVTFRPRLVVAATAIGQSLLLVGTVVLLVLGLRSPTLLLLPRSLSVVVTVAVLAAGLRVGARFLSTNTGARLPQGLLPFGIAVMTSAALSMAISQLDVFLLGVARGPTADAAYAPVSKVLDLVLTIFSLTGTYLLPPLVTQFTKGRHREAGNLYHWVSKWAMVICAPAVVALVAAPGPLLDLMFGSRSAALVVPARVLGAGGVVNVVLGFNGDTLAASGHTRVLFRNAFICLVSSVVFCVALVPNLGALGAALATTGTITLSNALASGSLWRRTSIACFNLASAAVAAALVAAIGVAWALNSLFSLSHLLAVMCALVVGAVLPLSVAVGVGGRTDLRIWRDAFLNAFGLLGRHGRNQPASPPRHETGGE